MTWGRYYWPIALIVISILFMPAEVLALLTNTKNTLSDYAWYELDITVPTEKFTAHTAAWFLTLGMYITVVVWLFYHIWFERFR